MSASSERSPAGTRFCRPQVRLLQAASHLSSRVGLRLEALANHTSPQEVLPAGPTTFNSHHNLSRTVPYRIITVHGTYAIHQWHLQCW